MAWIYSIYQNTGVEITFPLIADRSGEIATLYGMFSPTIGTTETVRDVFIIDPNQIIRAILIYPNTNGRNIPEILRLLQAIQITDKDHVVTPANWLPYQPAMVPGPKTYQELLERENDPSRLGLTCEDWYWCYTQIPPSS